MSGEREISQDALIQMINTLGEKIDEVKTDTGFIRQAVNKHEIDLTLHEKRITDLEDSTKSSIDWRKAITIGLIFIIIEAITQYFITQLF